MPKEKIYIVGHRYPDTDAICAPIAYAFFLRKKGEGEVVPARTGKINPETRFVLNYFKVDIPVLIKSAAGKKIILLDHNERSQSPKNIEKGKIIEVIDHHKINFEYSDPIPFRTEPIGSTSTIIAKKFFEEKMKIKKDIAGILLSGILSDTVIFRSLTTTKEDIEIAKKLARLAGIKNIEEFGIEMKKQKASLKGKKVEEIIFSDFKNFTSAGKRVGIGQVEILDEKEFRERRGEIIKKLKWLSRKKNYGLLLFAATSIIKGDSHLLAAGETRYLEKAFGKKVVENEIYLPGVVSRKKQIVPPLMKAFRE